MKDIKSKEYLKLYKYSTKTDVFRDFVLVTVKNGEKYKDTEVALGDSTLASIIDNHTKDMAKVIFYSRPIGLFDDIEVFGPVTNVGSTIYFGNRMSVAEANAFYHKDLDLASEKEVIVLENGDVVMDIDPVAETIDEVRKKLEKLGL